MFTQIKMKRDERGFTLIELLIVVAIIAILAAIAIPQFAAYRERGVRAGMIADARNAATQMEAYFTDYQAYTDITVGPGPTSGELATSEIFVQASRGNTLTITTTATAYTIDVDNANSGSKGDARMTGPGGTCTWLGDSTSC